MGRNQKLNQKMRDERREQILKSALTLFATKGLSATKITDISRHAGFSQGLLYHYFSSKEEIFTELVRASFDKLNEACFYLEGLKISPKEKIEFAIRELLKTLEDKTNAQHYLFITQASVSEATPETAKEIIKEKNTVPYEVIARIIRKGQKDGSITKHKANDLARVFWTSISGLAINKAIHGDKYKSPDPQILTSMFLTTD